MRLSKNFLNDYIKCDIDFKKVANDMTLIGNEYESVSKLVKATNLVIGKIIECIPHPDSDHLHVCQVDIGKEVKQIVCGAKNARVGIKVIVALVGAVLPEITIKKSTIRGVESDGMMCSLEELGIDKKYLHEYDIQGIKELADDAIVGDDPIEYLKLNDEVIDFELTSNRGDLLSVLGMAYEIGALYNLKVGSVDTSYQEKSSDINNDFELDVNTPDCPLFLAKKVCGVVIKESPLWLKNRLIASGIRPINNVVDISNYVMLELGQPLHFYDANSLGKKIFVRNALENEEIVTLDQKKHSLLASDIVIASEKEIVSLAGIMGGANTEVSKITQDIIIESAIFDPIKIRKTAMRVLRSEASSRFEKGIDPARTYLAVERACHLLEKYADAKISKGQLEYNRITVKEKSIDITVTKINKVLGIDVPLNDVIDIFQRLGFRTNNDGENINVVVPTRRLDINIKEDLIEEVGRIYGLDKINGKLPVLSVRPGTFNQTNRLITNKLIDMGLSETISYTLVKNDDVHKYTNDIFEEISVLDPMTEDRVTLRYSLLPSLKLIYDYNKSYSLDNIAIFELGKGFYQKDNIHYEESKVSGLLSGNYVIGLQPIKYDFYILKGIVEELLVYLGYNDRYSFLKEDLPKELNPLQASSIIVNGKKIGIMGKLHPSISKDDIYVFEINLTLLLNCRTKGITFKEISKFPTIVKDVAFVVKKNISSGDIMKVIKKAGGKLLTNIEVFDIYTGDNILNDEKSIAYSLTFMDLNRTLLDEEVNNIFNKIITEVEINVPAKLRS